MGYPELLAAVLAALNTANLEYDLIVIDYACRYFYSNLDRKNIYEELKKQFSKEYTCDILMIYDCLKDLNKMPFPKYTSIITSMRTSLAAMI